MWIPALSTYTLQFINTDLWREAFAQHPAADPGIGLRTHVGFQYLEESDGYVDTINDHHAFVVVVSERVLPKEAVDREVRRRGLASDGTAEKDAKSSWAGVEGEMLSNAPVREKLIPVVYDDATCTLYVFASASHAEKFVHQALRNALGTLMARPVTPRGDVGKLMTQWMREGKAPAPLLLGHTAQLMSSTDDGKSVFKNRDLSVTEVLQHLESGDVVERLHMNYGTALEFSLTRNGELKAIAPPECKMKPQQVFNIWPDVMAVLPNFFADMMAALGGAISVEELKRVEERPARVAILAAGGESDLGRLVHSMDGVLAKRKIGEVVIPALAEPLMRRVYAWAKHHSIAIKLIEPAPAAAKDLSTAILKEKPKGVLVWGGDARVEQLVAAATAKKLPVLRLEPRPSS